MIDAIRGAWALARLDPQAPELAAIARGERIVTLAVDEEQLPATAALLTQRASTRQAATASTGEKWYVPDGLSADLPHRRGTRGQRRSLCSW